MDFSNRNVQSQAPVSSAHVPPAGPAGVGHKKQRADRGKWTRIGAMTLLGCIVILLVGVIILLASGGVKSQDKYVNTGKLQAVFLNTGQVYFGNIKAINDKYFVLTNIYYLQTSSSSSSSSTSTANSNVTLVKLGCELHQPYDQMVINTQQVTFWENLQSTGQVAQAVAKFQQQNPNGQKCSDQSSSSGATTNSTQPATSSGGSTGSTSTNP